MKVVKKILIGLLIFILIDLIAALAISFNIKSIIIDGVIKETIKHQVTANEYNENSYTISEEQIKEITDDERIQEILNSQEVQDLLEKYLDTTINGLIDESTLDEVELEKDMLEFLKENKQVLEDKVGVEITDEMIDQVTEQAEGKDLTRAYKDSIRNSSRTMTTTEKTVLKGYNYIISNSFRILIIVLMIIDLLLIAILQKSFYKWIKSMSHSMIISGIGIIIMSVISSTIVKNMTSVDTFNTSSLTYTGIGITIVGIIILIIYTIIIKIIEKKKANSNEIS